MHTRKFVVRWKTMKVYRKKTRSWEGICYPISRCMQYTLAEYGQVNGNMILTIKYATILASSLTVHAENVAPNEGFHGKLDVELANVNYELEKGEQTKTREMNTSVLRLLINN